MSEYKYINDYEREHTQKYEGVYTPKEIELNNKLYEECSKKVIDYEAVEDLLKNGADPLGGTAIGGWGLFEHIYGQIICDSQDNDSINLPQITELFLKYDMDIDNPRIPYDNSNSINPMWDFTFIVNESATKALKMLLDNNLSADSFEEFWDHSMFDLLNCACGDPENDEFWNHTCIWTLKMMFLGASYDHILENDQPLKEFIAYDKNTYDIHKFRNWNDFYYVFDTSRCKPHPELYQSVVKIYEIETNREVWRMGICLKESEF